MTSSSTTTQLGRILWGSIRDSVAVLSTKLPGRRPLPGRPNAGPSVFSSPAEVSSSLRLFYPARSFSFRPYVPRITRGNVRKSCSSGGLLLLGLSSSPSPTAAVVTTCTAAADSTLAGPSGQRASISHLSRQAWQLSVQARSCRGCAPGLAGKRASSSSMKATSDKSEDPNPPTQPVKSSSEGPSPTKTPGSDAPGGESLADSMSKYLHLPKIPNRPTKEELLATAQGFRQRLKVRFKWFSIRSMRPWNADEWGAFVSWFLFGHLVWILVGTTTFFSLIILFINTVFAQGRPHHVLGS